jgi:hypothetical protein
MKCAPTQTPEQVDIPAIREKYRHERDKRMRVEGQQQYVRPVGDFADTYEADPFMPVAPREPISEDLDVAIIGARLVGHHRRLSPEKAGVASTFRNIDHAGDFGRVWYWNRYPGLQCDNDAYCYLPLLEETGFMPSKKFADGARSTAIQLIARKFGFGEKALFHTLVTEMRWDEKIKRWRIRTNRGDDIRARFVIMAGRAAQHAEAARHSRHPRLQGQDVSHRTLGLQVYRRQPPKPGARQAGRQARGDHRHGRDRDPGGSLSRPLRQAALCACSARPPRSMSAAIRPPILNG